jgi:hypothetical protein
MIEVDEWNWNEKKLFSFDQVFAKRNWTMFSIYKVILDPIFRNTKRFQKYIPNQTVSKIRGIIRFWRECGGVKRNFVLKKARRRHFGPSISGSTWNLLSHNNSFIYEICFSHPSSLTSIPGVPFLPPRYLESECVKLQKQEHHSSHHRMRTL